MTRTVRALVLLSTLLSVGSLAPPLRRALKVAKPLVVELQVDEPDKAWKLDVEELSERLRTAGASALVAPSELLATVLAEQGRSKGGFPGPVPVLCMANIDDEWSATLDAAKDAGAAGLAVRCAEADHADALGALLEASETAGLECLVIAGADAVVSAAQTGGASAIACAYEGAVPPEASSSSSAVVLGGWDGEESTLARLRADGFDRGLYLIDGCGGDVAAGAAYCESRVKLSRSSASKEWGGSMFASTSADTAPPGVRNPRLWAQAQRQAREIQYESAKSRDLPPPKLGRNSVLGGGGK